MTTEFLGSFWGEHTFHKTICPAIVSTDRERIVLGTEDGLFVVEITRDGMSTPIQFFNSFPLFLL